MLQRHVITFGNVLIRALVGDSRSGYNVSLVEVRVNVETVLLNANLYCGNCHVLWCGKYGVEPF
jgi:hypothetical protein